MDSIIGTATSPQRWLWLGAMLVGAVAAGCNLHRRDVGYVQSGIGGGQSVIYPETGTAAANVIAPTPTPALAASAVATSPVPVAVAPMSAAPGLAVAQPGGTPVVAVAPSGPPVGAVAQPIFSPNPVPAALPAALPAAAGAVVPPFVQPAFTFATPTTGSSFVPSGVVLVPGAPVVAVAPPGAVASPGGGAPANAGLRLQPVAQTPVSAGILPVGFLSGANLAGLRLHPRLATASTDGSEPERGVEAMPRNNAPPPRTGPGAEELAPLAERPGDREASPPRAQAPPPARVDPGMGERAPPAAAPTERAAPLPPPRARSTDPDFSEGVPVFPAPGRTMPEPLAPPKPVLP